MSTALVSDSSRLTQNQTTASPTTQGASPMAGGVLIAALLIAGTGAIATPQSSTQVLTGSITPICTIDHFQQETGDVTADVQEKIAGIRHYLSLTTTDLASVLQVKRPTIYAWTAGAVSLHRNHRARLDMAYEIARDWRALSMKPIGEGIREKFAGGAALIDLLSADQFDHVAIRSAMLRAKDFQDQMIRRLTVKEVAKQAGVKLASRSRRNWPSSSDIDV